MADTTVKFLFNKLILPITIGLFLIRIKAVFAVEEVTSFAKGLDLLIEYLGPSGPDFLLAFLLGAAIIYLAMSNVPIFQPKTGAPPIANAVFSLIGGLVLGFYVYKSKIPFLDVIGTYFYLIIILMLGLILVYVVRGMMKEALELHGTLGIIGLGLLVIGMLLLFTNMALVWLGVLSVIASFVCLFFAAFLFFSKFKFPSFKVSFQGWRARRIGREYESLRKEIVLLEDERKIEQKIKEVIYQINTRIRKIWQSIMSAKYGEVYEEIYFSQKLINELKGYLETQRELVAKHLGSLKQLLASAPEDISPEIETLIKRLETTEDFLLKKIYEMSPFIMETLNNCLNMLSSINSAIRKNDIKTAKAQIENFVKLFKETENKFGVEFNYLKESGQLIQQHISKFEQIQKETRRQRPKK